MSESWARPYLDDMGKKHAPDYETKQSRLMTRNTLEPNG